MNGNIFKIVGMIYAVVAFFILVYFFYKNKVNKKIEYTFLGISTLLGFLIFAPMIPLQFQLLILGAVKKLGVSSTMVVVVLLLFIFLTALFGRIFCGYICPIGTIQELLYNLPTKKIKIKNKIFQIIFRLIFFSIFLVLGVFFSKGILMYFGIKEFFGLDIYSPLFYVFLTFLILSIFVYRPFCRFFCPYGVLLSFASMVSIFKLRRDEKCKDCKLCEDACPTNEAGKKDLKLECYLCNRCQHVCPVDGVIKYRRK